MPKATIFVLTILIVHICNICAPSQTKCMLIGAPPGEENAEYDQYIVPRLEAWGYTVDKKYHSTELASFTDADYAAYDFIFLSETALSDDVPLLREIPKPMLVSDGWMVKEASLGFAPGIPAEVLEPAVPVVFLQEGAGHPLAAGYAPGTVVDLCTVEEVADPCLLVWGQPSIPVIPIAAVASDPTQLMAYGLEKGTQNVFGEATKNRVAMVGVHAWGYQTLTEVGVNLYKAGIEWVMGGGATSLQGDGSAAPANPGLARVYRDPFGSLTRISLSLPKQGRVKLAVWNVLGRRAQSLVDGKRTAGGHSVARDACHMPGGVYFLKFETGSTGFRREVPPE